MTIKKCAKIKNNWFNLMMETPNTYIIFKMKVPYFTNNSY
jgi:hypothetical protein